MESLQKKLSRVRKPRVHITYDVETEGASIEKSLPFVVGVLGDFSGNASSAKGTLKDRKFIQIDQDNFDEVMTHIEPKVTLTVNNYMQNDNSEIGVDLTFKSIDDFEPINIIKQVEPLYNLLQMRNKLRDLTAKVDRSDELGGILESVLQSTDEIQKLGSDLGIVSNSQDQASTTLEKE